MSLATLTSATDLPAMSFLMAATETFTAVGYPFPSNPFAGHTMDPNATQDGSLTAQDIRRLSIQSAILGAITPAVGNGLRSIRRAIMVPGGPIGADEFNRAVRSLKFAEVVRVDGAGLVWRVFEE